MTHPANLTPEALHEVLSKAGATLHQVLDNRSRRPNVDLFAELRLSEMEAFHTRMLAFLLNPKAAHGQKTLFLDLWLKCLPLHGPSTGAVITIEHPITSGRADLLIRLPDHIILVENKVYAGEGEAQLSRYQDWLKKQKAARTTLIFLTPEGRKPQSGAADLCLSYGNLALWLDDCVMALNERLDPGQELASVISLYRRSCLALATPENSRMPLDPSLMSHLNTRELVAAALTLQDQMVAFRLHVFTLFWGRVKLAVENGLCSDWSCHLDELSYDKRSWPLLAIHTSSKLPQKGYYYVAAGNLVGLREAHAYFGITRRSEASDEALLREAHLRVLLSGDFEPAGDWVGVKRISDLPGQCACRLTDVDDVLALHADNTEGSAGLAQGIATALLDLWTSYHSELAQLNAVK